MDGWKRWKGTKVFIKTKSGRNYSGKIIDVEETGSELNKFTWIIMIDKFGNEVQFNSEEITFIQGEQ